MPRMTERSRLPELNQPIETGQSPAVADLAAGGFAAETEILTTTGPRRVGRLTPEDRVYALNLATSVMQPKRVLAVEPVTPTDSLVEIRTRRGHLKLLQDHRIPYQTKSISRIRTHPAGELATRQEYKFVNDWQTRAYPRLEQVDMTELAKEYEVGVTPNCHGHTFRARLPDGCEPSRYGGDVGYYFDPDTFETYRSSIEDTAAEVTIHAGPNHWRRPITFDGDDFLEFLGWFITEGSITHSSNRDTSEIGIAQKTASHRERIAELFDRMEIDVCVSENGFSFSSKLFARVLTRLCGGSSHEKRLPEFVFTLPREQQELLLDTLFAGDGNDWGVYYTASDQLAADILRLFAYVEYKPRYTVRNGNWQLYLGTSRDGFSSTAHVSSTTDTSPCYRLTVADYSAVMAGMDGKFQWVGVSQVG
ncbi:hypothetical protein GCM10027435_02270 [Haloparvum alkalitolerans]